MIYMENISSFPYERCVIIHVTGKVQGVGFRFFTYQKAKNLNLVGYVKNREDGSVKIVSCGKHSQVSLLIDWLEKGGPSSADIEHCYVDDFIPQEHYSSFNVRY